MRSVTSNAKGTGNNERKTEQILNTIIDHEGRKKKGELILQTVSIFPADLSSFHSNKKTMFARKENQFKLDEKLKTTPMIWRLKHL